MDHFAARTWCPAGQSEGDAPAPDIRRSGCRNLEPAPIGDRRIFDAHAPHPTPGNPHPTTAIAWGPPDLRLGSPRKRGPPSKHLPPHEILRFRRDPGLGHLAAESLAARYWRRLVGALATRKGRSGTGRNRLVSVHLVIGANGFAGRHAVTALGQHGPVRAADLGDGLAAAMEGVEVVHVTAQLYSPFDRLAWRARWRRGRPNGLLVELMRLAREAGVRRVVVMSSTSALGTPRDGRVTERTRPVPEHPYERLLASDEAWLREQYDPDVVLLRPAQAFGAGEP